MNKIGKLKYRLPNFKELKEVSAEDDWCAILLSSQAASLDSNSPIGIC